MVGKHGRAGGRKRYYDGESMVGQRGMLREEILALYSFSSLLLLVRQGLQSSDGTSQIQGDPQLFLKNPFTDKSRNIPNPVKLTMEMNY